MIRRVFMIFAAAMLIALPNVASAMTIEKIVSPSGIEAWLVREKSVPLITLNYAFHGGASQDDADKSGAAHFAADLLDEGAGVGARLTWRLPGPARTGRWPRQPEARPVCGGHRCERRAHYFDLHEPRGLGPDNRWRQHTGAAAERREVNPS